MTIFIENENLYNSIGEFGFDYEKLIDECIDNITTITNFEEDFSELL